MPFLSFATRFSISILYRIYFTQFPYILYKRSNQIGNNVFENIGLELIRSQTLFWASNSFVCIVVYNYSHDVNYYYINYWLVGISSVLYITSVRKAMNLLIFLR
jgi:hypothetical protein